MKFKVLALSVLLVLAIPCIFAADGVLKPYFLAANLEGDLESNLETIGKKLTDQNFEILGNYTPYENVRIIIVTNDALKNNAAASEFGGYGAVQRIALTKVEDNIQLTYTNPVYMAHVYRLKSDLSDVAAQLKEALGSLKEFGSEEGLPVKKLRKYHYMMAMPYFDDPLELAEFDTHDKAVAAVEKGLAAGLGGTIPVYKVEIPGKDEVLFGVGLKDGSGADSTVMGTCDKGEIKHSAHLPYELLVSKGDVYALHGKFRIAQSFPDLTMGTFMKIVGAPGSIKDSLKAVTGN